MATNWLTQLALFRKMNNFFYGKLDVTAVIYFVSVSAFFLFLTGQSVEKKRWN
jgi:ABC-2 type transport system permease protein